MTKPESLLERNLLIASAFFVGAVLRLVGLSDQILVDDELHAIHAALEMPLSEILVTYRVTDYCQPLTAFYRFLMDRGVVLTEAHLRFPILLSSLAAIVILPMLASRWIGDRASILFAWLISLSPMLVLYGRMIRSYAPAVLLGTSAVLVFYAWTRRPRVLTGVSYVLLACSATYFHLGTATFVLSPFLFVALEMGWSAEERKKWPRTALLASLTAIGLLAFLAPAWPTLGSLIASTRIEQSFRWAIVPPVLAMQAGSSSLPVVVAFWCLALLGLGSMIARLTRFALFTVSVAIGHVMGLLVLSPWGLSSPQIFNRYILVLTPIFLLWVAVGLGRATDRLSSSRLGRLSKQLATATAVLLLFAAGPLVSQRFRMSSFVHSHDLLSIFTEPARLPQKEIPRFYEDLALRLPAGPIIEYPHRTSSLVDKTAYIYQEIHRRRVLASTLDPRLRDSRLALRGHVAARREDLLASDARYLLIHLDPEAEEAAIIETRWMRVFPMPGEFWEAHRGAAARLEDELRASWGPPDHTESQLRVWDLGRVRDADPGRAGDD